MTSHKPKGKMREGEEEGGSEERCVREGEGRWVELLRGQSMQIYVLVYGIINPLTVHRQTFIFTYIVRGGFQAKHLNIMFISCRKSKINV